MTPKGFTGLAIAAVLSLIVAGYSYAAHNNWGVATASGMRFLPGLEGKTKDIAKIELHRSGKVLTLSRKDKSWGIAERNDYPVHSEKLRTMIHRLAEAELVEPKTSKPERYKLLGLGDPSGKDVKSTRVKVRNAAGAILADFILGERRWQAFGAGKNGVYVRKLNDPQTWLANVDVATPMEVKDWVDTNLFTLKNEDIVSVTITHPGQEPLTIKRTGKGFRKYVLPAPPAGKTVKADANPDEIAKTVAKIDMIDVRKLADRPADAKLSLAKVVTKNGLTLILELRKVNADLYWLALKAVGTGKAEKTAKAINARTKGWEYKIPRWKADMGFRQFDYFLKKS